MSLPWRRAESCRSLLEKRGDLNGSRLDCASAGLNRIWYLKCGRPSPQERARSERLRLNLLRRCNEKRPTMRSLPMSLMSRDLNESFDDPFYELRTDLLRRDRDNQLEHQRNESNCTPQPGIHSIVRCRAVAHLRRGKGF